MILKIIFLLLIKREFELDKNKNKLATILITDKNINQLFIDNINGAEIQIKDVKKINIKDFVNINPKIFIVEEMITF